MKKFLILIGLILLSSFIFGSCSQSIENKLKSAEKDFKVGDFARADRKIKEIAQIDSTAPEALYGQALRYEYHSYEWEAIFVLVQASSMRGGYLPAMDAFTRLSIDLDYLGNARKMAGLYIRLQPDSPIGYRYLIDIDVRENKFDSARVHYNKLAALGIDPADLTLAEAQIAFYSDDEDAISSALARLSQISLKSAERFSRLADLYNFINMGDSAIQYGRMAVEKDSKSLDLKIRLGRYLLDEMRLSEAYEVVSPIVARHEEYGAARILMSEIIWKTGKANDGDQYFFNYMTLDRESPISSEKHGDFYASLGDIDAAAVEWQSAYTRAVNLKYPDDYLRQLYLKMINGFLQSKDIGTAIDYFKEGLELLPDSLEMTFFEADLKCRFPETADSARMLVDDHIDQHQNDKKWLELAAAYFLHRNRYDQSAILYRRLLELPNPKLEYYLALLDMYRDDKNVEGADAIAAHLPFRLRNSLPLQKALLDVYYEADQVDRATIYAEALYRHTTEFMPYIITLADLYSRSGRDDEARRMFTKYLNNFPNNAESHYRVARFDYDHGHLDAVMEQIQKSLAIDSGYAYSYELKGEYFQAMGNMDSAIAAYEKAISLQLETPVAYHNLAEYYLNKQDNLDRAAGLAMAAIRYFDKDRRGYLLLGRIYYDQGKFKMARLQFFKGSKLFPEDAEYQFLLGKTYVQLKENAEAKKALKMALDLNLASPQKEEAQALLAKL